MDIDIEAEVEACLLVRQLVIFGVVVVVVVVVFVVGNELSFSQAPVVGWCLCARCGGDVLPLGCYGRARGEVGWEGSVDIM